MKIYFLLKLLKTGKATVQSVGKTNLWGEWNTITLPLATLQLKAL